MAAFGRVAPDGAEAFDTVDTDYLSSRGCYNAWVNGRRWSVNSDQ